MTKSNIVEKVDNAYLLQSIASVFSLNGNGLYNSNKIYNIPEYQRGYKWTDSDVTQLLDDIYNFSNENNDEDSFYCLQNITLVNKNNSLCNVVDGQQRLTTSYIILSFLSTFNYFNKEILKGKIIYSISHNGENTGESLINDKLLNKQFWNNLSEKSANSATHKDEYYIIKAAYAVKNWFNSEEKRVEKFVTPFMNNVKFIVNEVDGNEEQIFANINSGKVPLDGADLVRALIITKAAREKFQSKFDSKVNEFRVRLGMELDSINRWWSRKDVKEFFILLLPNEFVSNNSSFNIKDYPINLLYCIYYEVNREVISNKKISFKFFENGINHDDNLSNDHYEMYNDILTLHYSLKDWFNDISIYSLLAYLFSNFKASKYINLRDMYKSYKEKVSSKNDFILYLKKLIKEKLISSEIFESEQNDVIEENKTMTDFYKRLSCDSSNNYDWYNDDLTVKLLPLIDVIYTLKNDKNQRLLPLEYFKVNAEDKEHIHPQTVDETKNVKNLKDPSLLNSIGNIVLLNQSVNRSYHNESFDKKLVVIIKEYFSQKTFIRPSTLSVFLKNDGNGTVFMPSWEDEDIKNNANKIVNLLKDFLGEN